MTRFRPAVALAILTSLLPVAGAWVATGPPRITGGAAVEGQDGGEGDEKNEASKVARVGEPAPGFSLPDIEGEEHSLADYRGKIVVLEWANRRCPVWRRVYEQGQMPKTIRVVREIDEDVVWLAINSTHDTSPKENRAWAKKHDLEQPILLDPEGTVGRRYDARTTPHMFVIDAEGVLRYSGALDSDPNGLRAERGKQVTNYVVEAVRALAADGPVKPAETRPYGCAVKYATR